MDKHLLAAFFVPRIGQDPSKDLTIEGLLERVEATNIFKVTSTEDINRLYYCQWGEMYCQAYLDNLPYHQLLEIFFFESDFLAMLRQGDLYDPIGKNVIFNDKLAVEQDGALELALLFKKACEALQPEVAFIAVHPYQAQPEWVLDNEWAVLSYEANFWADQDLGLLYLDEKTSQQWTHNPIRDYRDSLPVAKGKLVFAGRGGGRWW